MKRMMLVASLATVSLLAAGTERTLSADGTVLTFDIPAGTIYTNAVAIESTVTNIVKTGAGDAFLGNIANTTYTGGITVEAGFLSGMYNSFGKPSQLWVTSDPTTGVGGAFVWLDLKPASVSTTDFPFWNTKFHLSGSGPDGTGALQRPVAHCDSVINGFAKEVWLEGDTTINFGSRWGFASSTLYMNNHRLTCDAGKNAHGDSPTPHAGANATWGHMVQMARNGSLAIKDPGEIVVTNGCRLLIEGGSKVYDATGSNGKVAEMPVIVANGCELRIFTTSSSSASNFRAQMAAGSGYNVNGTSYFNGPLKLEGGSVNLKSYSNGSAGTLRGGVSGPARLAHSENARYAFGGTTAHTNIIAGLDLSSVGPVTFQDDETFLVTNGICLGNSSLSTPATLVLKDRAKLGYLAAMRTSSSTKMWVGSPSQADQDTYGMLRLSGDSVVSNAVYIGYYGRGAVYVADNATLHFRDNANGSNNAFVGGSQGSGQKAYGYLGQTGGTVREDFWFNIAGNGNTRGVIVQKGGRFEHNGASEPVRFGFNGTACWSALAQYGGTSVWKNYAALGFANYTPTAQGITASLTVAGTNTLMDFSSAGGPVAGILCNANTNAANPNTACINVNDAGTLYVKRIGRGQITGNGAPSWASISNRITAGSQYYLNFNGGILKTAQAGEFFGSTATDPLKELTRATVFEKGVVIDTDGKDVMFRMALQKPYGLGIKSVTLPANVLAETATNLFIGPTRPIVTATTRTIARTADLMMDFDDATRRAKGVIVNSPGFGFTQAPTVTFEKANCSDTWSCTVETVDFDAASFVHGGFTKRGLGTLTLTSTNTYGGVTRVEAGTLAFTHADGYPGGDLEFPAGAVTNCAAPRVTAVALPFRSGAVIRVTEADQLDKACCRGFQTVATTTTPLAALPSVTYVDGAGEPVVVSGAWLFRLGNGRTVDRVWLQPRDDHDSSLAASFGRGSNGMKSALRMGIGFALVGGACLADATTVYWAGTNTTSWSATDAWSMVAVPTGASDLGAFPSGGVAVIGANAAATNAVVTEAPVTVDKLQFAATATGPTTQTLSGTGSVTFVDGEISVASGIVATVSAPFVGSVPWTKTGQGTLVLCGTNKTYRPTGPLVVREGLVKLERFNPYSIGGSFSSANLFPVTVESGASLDLYGSFQLISPYYLNITIAGTGPDGGGALRDTGMGDYNKYLSRVTLAADAAIGSYKSLYISTIDTQGHEVTKVGSTQLCVSNLAGDGDFRVKKSYLTVFGTAGLAGSGRLILDGGDLAIWVSGEANFTKSVVVNGNNSIYVSQPDAKGLRWTWSGPVAVAANKTLTFSSNVKDGKGADNGGGATLSLTAPLSGEGTVTFHRGTNYLLSSSINVGTLKVNADQVLHVGRPGEVPLSLGTSGRFVNNGTTYFHGAGQSTNTILRDVTGTGRFNVYETNTVVFKNCKMENRFEVPYGEVTLDGVKGNIAGDIVIGSANQNNYTNLAQAAANVFAFGNNVMHSSGVLNICGDTDLTITSINTGNGYLAQAGVHYPITGIVNQVSGKILMTGSVGDYSALHLGHWPTAQTWWNMSGGELRVTNAAHRISVAVDGTGRFNLSGGAVYTPEFCVNCRNGSGGNGTFTMTGGDLWIGVRGLTAGDTSTAGVVYKVTLGGGAGGTVHAWNGDSLIGTKATLAGTTAETAVTFDTGTNVLTVGEALTGTGGFNKTGAGMLVLTNANTYAGTGRIQAGFARLGDGGSVTGTLETAVAAVIDLAGHTVTKGIFAGAGILSNGVIGAGATLRGGASGVGTNTVRNVTVASGATLDVCVTADGCGLIDFDTTAAVALDNVKVAVANPDALDPKQKYVFARCAKGLTASLDQSKLPDGWHVKQVGKTLVLDGNNATLLIFR